MVLKWGSVLGCKPPDLGLVCGLFKLLLALIKRSAGAESEPVAVFECYWIVARFEGGLGIVRLYWKAGVAAAVAFWLLPDRLFCCCWSKEAWCQLLLL